MKLDLAKILAGVLTAAIIGCGSWIFSANATISSLKATSDSRHEAYLSCQQRLENSINKLNEKIDKHSEEEKENFKEVLKAIRRNR
jgi:peptidoglycan hydrolase CwlO-like protein